MLYNKWENILVKKLNQKTQEEGRSILELIAVLAVIGLLSIGGIKIYDIVMSKAEAENTAKMISTLVSERQIKFMKNDSEITQETIKGPHGDLIVEKGTAGNRKKYFWVTVKPSNKIFCEELIGSSLIGAEAFELDDKLNGECPAEKVTFYFPKNPSDTPSLTYTGSDGQTYLCPEGTICQNKGDENNDGTEDGKNDTILTCDTGYYENDGCKKCPENAAICEGENLDCAAGYYKKNGDCIQCDEREISSVGALSCQTCPEGQKNNSDHTDCVICSTSETCGCSGGTPYTDGNGGCVECRSNYHCRTLYPNLDSNSLICTDNACQTKKGCDSANPILSDGHCCPVDKPYWDGSECILKENNFEGADGTNYSCDTDYAVQISTVEANCSLCDNREVLTGYCVPKCGEGKFLVRTSDDTVRPKVYCEDCTKSTGWMYGPLNCSYCSSRCPGRECYNLGFNPQYQCQLKECPTGTYSCASGCCSCDSLSAEQISKWYTGYGSLRANAVSSCEACNGKYGSRKATTSGAHYCYLENCPAGYFRSGLNCISCNNTSSTSSTEEECQKCTDVSGNYLRHYEGGYCIKGNTCANGTTYSAENGCSSCPEGTFFVAGSCISCDDPKYYSEATDETECAKCPQRTMHTVRLDSTGNPTTCMLKAVVGESWYSAAGTNSCDSSVTGTVYTQMDECLAYCPNRIVRQTYTCALPCSEGEFLGTTVNTYMGECHSCEAEGAYILKSITKRENDQNITTTPNCTDVCPGKRFSRVVNGENQCIKCFTDATQFNTQEECESCLRTWDSDSEKCT